MIEKSVEGRGRGKIWDTLPAFVWRHWEKLRKLSDKSADLWLEIWIEDITNMKHGY
jgi:hypothetical protein